VPSLESLAKLALPIPFNQIDEPFERGPLLCPVESPAALINEIPVLVSGHHTEEIFKSTLSNERIAFEIKKEVADRGCGEPKAFS
jgi:hypothetical protein